MSNISIPSDSHLRKLRSNTSSMLSITDTSDLTAEHLASGVRDRKTVIGIVAVMSASEKKKTEGSSAHEANSVLLGLLASTREEGTVERMELERAREASAARTMAGPTGLMALTRTTEKGKRDRKPHLLGCAQKP